MGQHLLQPGSVITATTGAAALTIATPTGEGTTTTKTFTRRRRFNCPQGFYCSWEFNLWKSSKFQPRSSLAMTV